MVKNISSSLFNHVVKSLLWFFPVAILTAFFTGLSVVSMCFSIMCSSSEVENKIFSIALGLILLTFLYVPYVVFRKILLDYAGHKYRRAILLIVGGYVLIFGLTMGWITLDFYTSQEYGPDVNEKIMKWIQKSY